MVGKGCVGCWNRVHGSLEKGKIYFFIQTIACAPRRSLLNLIERAPFRRRTTTLAHFSSLYPINPQCFQVFGVVFPYLPEMIFHPGILVGYSFLGLTRDPAHFAVTPVDFL